MVCGIHGWVNGGKAATGSVRYLVGKLKACKFAEIPISRFYVFHMLGQPALRPHIKIEDGVISFIEANGGVLIAMDIGCDGVIDIHNGEILDVVVFNNEQIILI